MEEGIFRVRGGGCPPCSVRHEGSSVPQTGQPGTPPHGRGTWPLQTPTAHSPGDSGSMIRPPQGVEDDTPYPPPSSESYPPVPPNPASPRLSSPPFLSTRPASAALVPAARCAPPDATEPAGPGHRLLKPSWVAHGEMWPKRRIRGVRNHLASSCQSRDCALPARAPSARLGVRVSSEFRGSVCPVHPSNEDSEGVAPSLAPRPGPVHSGLTGFASRSHRLLPAPWPPGHSHRPPLRSARPLSLSPEDGRPVRRRGQLPGKDQLPGPRHGQPEAAPVRGGGDGGAGVACVLGGLPSGPQSRPVCSCQRQQRQQRQRRRRRQPWQPPGVFQVVVGPPAPGRGSRVEMGRRGLWIPSFSGGGTQKYARSPFLALVPFRVRLALRARGGSGLQRLLRPAAGASAGQGVTWSIACGGSGCPDPLNVGGGRRGPVSRSAPHRAPWMQGRGGALCWVAPLSPTPNL